MCLNFYVRAKIRISRRVTLRVWHLRNVAAMSITHPIEIVEPSVPMKILVGPFSLFDFCAAPITFLTYKLQPPFAQQKPECIHSARAPWRASAAMDATNNDLVVQLKINIVILPRVSCIPFLQLHRGINSPRSLFLHLKSD